MTNPQAPREFIAEVPPFSADGSPVDDDAAEAALADMPRFSEDMPLDAATAEMKARDRVDPITPHIGPPPGMLPPRETVVEAGKRIAEEARQIRETPPLPGERQPQPAAIDGHRPDSNPKSALGIKKVPLHLVSPISILHEAMAMAEGGMKYGPYNYREDEVAATVYCAAALRHIFDWMCGEEMARDSNIHHLGHGKACLGILLDAQACGSLIDDRYKTEAYRELLDMYTEMLPKMAERIAAMSQDLEAHNR